MGLLDRIKTKVRGTIDLPRLKRDGLRVGTNFSAMEGVIIDPDHCWLIDIGNNVTLAPRVHILAHDASMKKHLGYARIGKVHIGDNCFLGASTVVLPNVWIDDNTIVGAGSVVTHSLIGGGVFVGNPCVKVCEYDQWIANKKKEMEIYPLFNESYKIGNITEEKKEEMKNKIESYGYII